MTKDVLICGSIAFDTISQFDGNFKDHIMMDNVESLSVSFLVPTMRKEFGGCAGNIAYNLKGLGGSPIPVGAVGADFSDYQSYLSKLGIDTRAILTLNDELTAQGYIMTDKQSNQITSFHPGAMARANENDISKEQAAWAIVAPESKEAMFANARLFVKNKIPFIFDLGQAMPLFDGDDLKEMIKLASAVTANEYEASVIEQRTGLSMEEISKEIQAVVVTHGPEGAELYQEGNKTHIKVIKAANIVDPTGCGDAHRAGLLYGLTEGWSWEQSCALGNIMGSIKIGSYGPQNHTINRVQIKDIYEHNYGKTPNGF